MTSDRVRILIVDDHPIVLFGLRLQFEGHDEMIVVGEARDVQSACRMTGELRPDVIVLDLVLGGRDGIELIGELNRCHPPARIIVYSSQDERHFARRVLRAGARGYVAKGEHLSMVADAVTAVIAGNLFVSAAVQQMLVADFARGVPLGQTRYEELSDREMQVLRMIGTGFSSQEIAAELGLSIKTVGTYRDRIKIKLGLDRARALEEAAREFTRSEKAG